MELKVWAVENGRVGKGLWLSNIAKDKAQALKSDWLPIPALPFLDV